MFGSYGAASPGALRTMVVVIVLADEPSSDLDEDTEQEIMALFSRIHAEEALTIVMVTHARSLVSFGTRHVEMSEGTVREDDAHARTPGAS